MNYRLQNLFYLAEKVSRGNLETPSSPMHMHHVLLSSFPKSGNTWLRFVVSNVNALAKGEEPVNFSTINNFAPAIRGNRKLIGAKLVDGFPLFLKTHFPYVQGFSGIRSVVIVRDPFKVIPSYQNYLQHAHGKKFSSHKEFYFHWRYGFNAWANFMLSWQNKATVILRYEDILLNNLHSLELMYQAIGYQVDKDLLKSSINFSSRDNMKKALNEFGDPNNSNGFDFVRNEGDNAGISTKEKELILNDLRLAPNFFEQARRYDYL